MHRIATTVLLLALALAPAGPGQVRPDFMAGMAGMASMADDVRRMEAPSNTARREVLESILTSRGIPFETEAFSIEPRPDYPRTDGKNLVVTLGTGETDIVIGAHYDAVWLPGGSLSAGAIDNAAGSVILTRLADALRSESFRHRIRIVLFDMEEIGLVGSARYATAYGARTAAAINLDVDAYGDTLIFGPARNPGNQDVYRLVKEVCVAQGLDFEEFPVYPPSDDRSFQAAGVPNVSIGILPSAEARHLWLSLNSDTAGIFVDGFVPRILEFLHTPSDRAELVEEAAMERVLGAVLALVKRLDSSDE